MSINKSTSRGHGSGSGHGYDFGLGYGNGDGYGSGYGSGDGTGSGYGSGNGDGYGDGYGEGSGYGDGSEYAAIMDSLARLHSGYLLAEPELDLLIKLGLSAELEQVAKRQLYKCRLDAELNKVLT